MVIEKNDIARVRSEVRNIDKRIDKYFEMFSKQINPETAKVAPFVGGVTGNYWTQTGMPWVADDARKAVLTEWFWQPIRRTASSPLTQTSFDNSHRHSGLILVLQHYWMR